ncbi:MAG: hypothetical protein F4Y39_24845 [Gemmatimonadetes bacterium]|nr:hypothetical protein [Gemmatimonadota bacterium]
MPRDHKTLVRMNDCEHYFAMRYATEEGVSLPEMIRALLHKHILSKEGDRAASYLLRGQPPAQ